MLISKNNEKKIKGVLKENYIENLYISDEIVNVANQYVNIIQSKNCVSDGIKDGELVNYIYKYLYFSSKEDKYYFNFKRKYGGKIDISSKFLFTKDGDKDKDKDINLVEEKKEADIINTNLENKDSTISLVILNLNPNKIDEVPKTIDCDQILEKLDNKKDNEELIDDSEDMEALENELFGKFTNEQNKTTYSYSKENKTTYSYPKEIKYNIVKRTEEKYGPFGSQLINDIQYNDKLDEKLINFSKQFDILRAIKLPDQRTPEWYKMRESLISASDGGTVVDVNKYEPQFKILVKKTTNVPFISNEHCYHGKKYEEAATLLYEYRMNVSSDEFGLISHPKYSFIGASPDRICNKYKNDGVHLSKYVGRMVEIKCPRVREIHMEGENVDEICPKYYWVQVQLQLECCDFEECDFWQCNIKEYDHREQFINDTNGNEPFRSKETGFEKGCLIQLIPKQSYKDVLDGKYLSVVWDQSQFIYPPKIEMTPYDCDIWIAKTLAKIQNDSQYKDFLFDKVLYWKLVNSKCLTILRDRKWFGENLPIFKQMWDYITFLRNTKYALKLFIEFIESRIRKSNKEIMSVMDKLYKTNDPNYKNFIEALQKDIQTGQKEIEIKMNKKYQSSNKSNNDQYMFV